MLGRILSLLGLRRFSLRSRLCLMVAAILIPALIPAGALALRSIATERAHIDEGLETMLHQLSVEIEREIQSTKALLVVVASSHFLQTGDLEGFHRNAEEISHLLGIQIAVHRPQADNRVISTGLPWNETPELTMPAVRLEAQRQAVSTGKIVISDVFFAPLRKRFIVSAIMPVLRNGTAEYVVAIAIPLQTISAILENASPGPDRTTIVLDRSHTIIARSAANELVAGTKAGAEFSSQLSDASGTFDAVNRFGEAFYGRYRKLETTGWYVAVSVRKTALDSYARNTIVYTAAAGSTLFAAAIGLAFVLGGRLQQRSGTLGIDRSPTREEFALLFDSAPNGVLLVDENGAVLLASARLEQMFGYAQKELSGQAVEALVPPELRNNHVGHRRGFANHRVARAMGGEQTLLGRRKDGSDFPIEVGLYPITIQSALYTVATVIDVTERSRAARKLSDALAERDRLRRHLMRAAEDERLRLSHELHDQTGQTLIAATLAAKSLEKSLDAGGRERLDKLNALLGQMGSTLHQVAWELRPASIDELGLAATLDNYVSDWSEQSGIAAEFYCKGESLDGLPGDVRTTIYRVIQEALTNISKHSATADRVSVIVSRAESTLQLIIDDNGDGFDLAEELGAPSKYGKLGIPSMRERLSLIGGTLEIESSPNVGTTVFARIPVETWKPPR